MYRTIIATAIAALALAACATEKKPAPAPASAPAPQAPVRALTQLKGDVYRWQDGEYFGVVLVTSEGIIVADPINTAASRWLKDELEKKFAGKPVKYVLYSHHHYDHVSGGAVFSDARVIAQADAIKNLKAPKPDAPLEGTLAGLDANKDGKIQKAELAANPFFAPQFEAWDINQDGSATASEIWLAQYADVRKPDGTFKNDYTLTLGGQSVHMIHVGGNHASDMTYMMFPGNILFVVDVINIKRLPFGTLADYDLDENFKMIDKAEALKPDIVTVGHGMVGTAADLEDVRSYFMDLIAGVKQGIADGKTLAQIQQSLTLDKYKDWQNYAVFRTQNIEGVYNKLKPKA